MNDYVILTDSTTDLSPELIEKHGLIVLPLTVNIDNHDYRNLPDGSEISTPEFYTLLRAGKTATTSQISLSSFIDAIEPILISGKDLLYIGFSSELSGTCNSGFLAVKELSTKYPQRKVLAVDSLSASMGEGLLVCLAASLKEEGKNIDEVYNWVLNNRLRLCHWFTVDDLNHLKRGGRLSSAAALLGTVLGIKPILHVDDNGKLVPIGKIRGRKQSLEQLVEKMSETGENLRDQLIFISHGDCIDDARLVEKMVRERFGVRDVVINFVGPVIGAHSGPGTMALFFLGSKR